MERGRSDVPATVEYEQCGKPDGSNGRKPDEVGNSGEVVKEMPDEIRRLAPLPQR